MAEARMRSEMKSNFEPRRAVRERLELNPARTRPTPMNNVTLITNAGTAATFQPSGKGISMRRFRSLAVMYLVVLLALAAGNSAIANLPDARTRWSIVPSPNEEGVNWLVAADALAGNDAWAVGYYIANDG